MSDFWWRHVVPARLALESGLSEPEVRAQFCPKTFHPWADYVKALSSQLFRASVTQRYDRHQTHSKAVGAVTDSSIGADVADTLTAFKSADELQHTGMDQALPETVLALAAQLAGTTIAADSAQGNVDQPIGAS